MFGLFKPKKPALTPSSAGYHAYTTAFDREVSARKLIREIRIRAPSLSAPLHELEALLKAPTVMRTKGVIRGVEFGSRFAKGHDLGDRPLVTLLIDHSGSMQGIKALTAAVAADVMGDALGNAGINFEMLGFTTSSWKGGNSRRTWTARGRMPNPGRLCDLLHIVYRDGAKSNEIQTWSRDLTVLLHPDELRENIDGEALQWAHSRATALNPTAWVCILLSDGAPLDDSTILANGGDPNNWYLARHLQSVVEELNAKATARLGCLCLEYDPHEPFRARRTVSVLETAPVELLDVLEDLIWPPTQSIADIGATQ